MEINIQLFQYGQNLGSRMLGKKLISDFEQEIQQCESVVLDFHRVRFVSLSFATELIHYLQLCNKKITYVGASILIEKQLEFALNPKSKELAPA